MGPWFEQLYKPNQTTAATVQTNISPNKPTASTTPSHCVRVQPSFKSEGRYGKTSGCIYNHPYTSVQSC